MPPASTRITLPEAFSSVTGLGTPVDYFPRNRMNRLTAPLGAATLLLASLISCGWGLEAAYGSFQQYGPAVIYNQSNLPLVVAAALFLGGVALIWYVLANRGKCIAVYENGLVYADPNGLRPMRWEEIGEFYLSITRNYSYGIRTGTTYHYTIRKLDGGRLAFDNRFERVQQLGGLIGRHTLPIQYKLAADIYNSGQTASFGPVAISRTGLTVNRKTYPWNDIERVSLQQGIFKVSKKGGGWFSGASTPVSSIPNLEVMLSIIDQVVGVKVGGSG